jgi:outer membrane protein OmpA-like peptidoglycan-associated protein
MNKLALVLAVLLASTAASAENFARGTPPERVQVGTMKSFDYGRMYVHTPEREELQRIAHLWRQRRGWTTITLEGHGYVANDEEQSIELGTRRAERVRDHLVKMGVDGRHIVVVGHSRGIPGRYVDILVDTCDRCRQ